MSSLSIFKSYDWNITLWTGKKYVLKGKTSEQVYSHIKPILKEHMKEHSVIFSVESLTNKTIHSYLEKQKDVYIDCHVVENNS